MQRVNSEDFVVVSLEPQCNSKPAKKRKDEDKDGTGPSPKPAPLSSRPLIPKKQRC